MVHDIDVDNLYDPVAEVINKQYGSIWKPELFQRKRVKGDWKHMHVSETPSTPYSYEDELNHAIDLKYGGMFKQILMYQYFYMGYTIQNISHKVGVDRRTVYRWIRKIRKDKSIQEALQLIVRGEYSG